jgi:hypothetical protein
MNYQDAIEFAADLMLEESETPSIFNTDICILKGDKWDLTAFYPFTSMISDDEEDEEDDQVLSITEVILEDFHLSCEIGDYTRFC